MQRFEQSVPKRRKKQLLDQFMSQLAAASVCQENLRVPC
jgi:hypothetical protein